LDRTRLDAHGELAVVGNSPATALRVCLTRPPVAHRPGKQTVELFGGFLFVVRETARCYNSSGSADREPLEVT